MTTEDVIQKLRCEMPWAIGKARETIARILGTLHDIEAEDLGAHGFCCYWAVAVATELQSLGYDACINAGEARFNINDEEAVMYPWNDEIDLGPHLENQTLPRLHAWCVIPSEQLIIDVTAGWIKQAAIDDGATVTIDDYPETLIFRADSPPEGVYYMPSVKATRFVYDEMEQQARESIRVDFFRRLQSMAKEQGMR